MAKPKIWKPKPLSIAETSYFREMHRIIDTVFVEATDSFDWSWTDLAEEANLCYATVANLGNRVTRWPRYHTIWKMCRAVGLNIAIEPPTKRAADGIRRAA